MGKRLDPGPGRTKGVPNRITLELKDMIMMALSKSGGVDYLVQLASAEPSSFAMLIGKLIPKDVNAKVTHSISNVLEEAEERGRVMRKVTEVDEDGRSKIVH